jgi:hypothetical protein
MKNAEIHKEVSAEWGSYSAWLSTCSISSNVLMPLTFIYRDYENFCNEWGFEKAPTKMFVRFLENNTEEVSVHRGGSGRIRTLVQGVIIGKK